MALPWGFDFCASNTYVTHGANAAGIQGDFTTPTSYNGQGLCSWGVAAGTGDRDTSVDAAGGHRLASINHTGGGGTRVFTVVLPSSGTYDISLALGDFVLGWPKLKATFNDNSTWVVSGNSGAANQYIDANNSVLTAANWIAAGAGVPKTLTFGSTSFTLTLTSTDGSDFGVISHLNIAASGGGVTDYGVSAFARRQASQNARLRL